jgi:hypothetical protein
MKRKTKKKKRKPKEPGGNAKEGGKQEMKSFNFTPHMFDMLPDLIVWCLFSPFF